MKTIFAILSISYNFSFANILVPENFRIEKRIGQFSSVFKTISGNETIVKKLKSCITTNKIPYAPPPIPPDCSMKKVIDTKEELKYETKCEETGLLTYHSKWITENILETITVDLLSRMEMKTSYDSPVCDKDAERL